MYYTLIVKTQVGYIVFKNATWHKVDFQGGKLKVNYKSVENINNDNIKSIDLSVIIWIESDISPTFADEFAFLEVPEIL